MLKNIFLLVIFLIFSINICADVIILDDGSWLISKIKNKTKEKVIINVENIEIPIKIANIKEIKKGTRYVVISEKKRDEIKKILFSKTSSEDKIKKLNTLGKEIISYLRFLVKREMQIEKNKEKNVYGEYEIDKEFYNIVSKATYQFKSYDGLPLLALIASHEKFYISEKAIEYIGNVISKASVYILINIFKTRPSNAIESLLLKINKRNPDLNIPMILKDFFLDNKITNSDYMMIRFLGKLKSADTLNLLEEISKNPDSNIAMSGIMGLGFAGLPESINILLERLENEENPVMKRQIIYALGETESIDLVPKLIPLLKSEDKRFVNSIYITLNKITNTNLPSNIFAWEKWWEYNEKIWPKIKEMLDDILYLEEEKEIIEALKKLENYQDIRSLNVLEEMLTDESAEIRIATCRCLWKINHPRVIKILLNVMEEDIKKVAEVAWLILRQKTGWELPFDAFLWQKFYDAQPEQNNKSNNALIKLIEDESHEIQYMAIKQIIDLKEKNSINSLKNILFFNIPEKNLNLAIVALKIFKDKSSVPDLIELLDNKNKKIRESAHSALISITKEKFPLSYDDWYIWWNEN